MEILDVTLDEDAAGRFAERSINRPRPGQRNDSTYELDVRGSAAGRDDRITAVEFHMGATVLARAPVGSIRSATADAAGKPAGSAPGEDDGFYLTLGALRLPEDFELRLEAVFERGEPAALGRLRGRRGALRRTFEPCLCPVMVTSPGRAGSTVFMRLLEGHPQIVAYPPFEHEARVATYWLEVLLALAEPSSYLRQVSPSGPLHDLWWLGDRQPVPRRLSDPAIQSWLGRDGVEAQGAFCMKRIEALYRRLDPSPDIQFFAEKFRPDRIPELAWELYPDARELILVRDVRDMVASIFAASDKRGAQQLPADRVSYVAQELKQRIGAAAGAWHLRRDRAHLVRYEDLMLDPDATLSAVLAYLGLDSSQVTIDAMRAHAERPVEAMARHRTTPDPAASIGRWKRDLSPELQEACERALAEELRLFGYER